MSLLRNDYVALAFGLVLMLLLALLGAQATGPEIALALSERAERAIAEAGGQPVRALFVSAGGSPSRHPLLTGGEGLDEATRDKVAKAIAAVPGVGGVRWSDGTMLSEDDPVALSPLHCQDDVAALLRARTIRFEEGSARIDAASQALLDEVATALRPCLGSIIAVTGHTDASGSEPGNLALSRERAAAVGDGLVARGIPADGLRIQGLGSRQPVEGLEPTDPANRRIEFGVLATEPIRPTPVDTPGPR